MRKRIISRVGRKLPLRLGKFNGLEKNYGIKILEVKSSFPSFHHLSLF